VFFQKADQASILTRWSRLGQIDQQNAVDMLKIPPK